MIIKRNKKRERERLELIKKHLEKGQEGRSDGVHVSDLVFQRKAYWRKVDPQPITDDEALFFTAGRAHHELLIAWSNSKGEKGKTDTGEHEWKGIYYSPDLIVKGAPDEIKTSRSPYPPGPNTNLEKEYQHYLRQLTCYMAAMNNPNGALSVFYISAKRENGRGTSPQLRCYDVRLNTNELKNVRKKMLLGKLGIKEAVKNKSHVALPLCPAWLCRGCVWLAKCKPWNGTVKMRLKNEEPSADYQRLKNLIKDAA